MKFGENSAFRAENTTEKINRICKKFKCGNCPVKDECGKDLEWTKK